ncbi:rhamnan synthesis F family protein [Agrococcus jejuensis]|uniref:Rhamnosyltransferase n=1 Tax=Agrococcus jejuensis TaxID=399736 RepID=A0A1G8FHJ9_9MICO|nr:rhamnan synthesis F family protein [Agrococcus jejuensis]SDH81641.1 rhamnosyltransferase [Agrococcus jejuensis]
MRRAVFYLVYDGAGEVGDYALHHLRAIRDHADHVFVVSNSPLSPGSRVALERVADTVWERENVGFDVFAYRDALRHFGQARLEDFDEIILMNYTFYGPIGSYAPLFERMDAQQVDFWGVTDHAEIRPNPYTHTGVMHRHIQSHWIAVRRPMVRSAEWKAYWDDMPPVRSYADSIQLHESRFTHHFEQAGFSSATAFPAADYPAVHPIFDLPARLLDEGLPIIKRRLFFHDPLYHDAHAIVARDVEDRMHDAGYPMQMLYDDLSRSAKPRDLNAVLSMMEILPDVSVGDEDVSHLRVGILAHVFYDDMIDEIADLAEALPQARLVITTADEGRKARIEERLAARGREADVRVLPSNRGRDISAFLLGCRDVLLSGELDLVVKLHSKRSPQNGFSVGQHFKRHLYENLLGSPGYAENLLRLFVRHETLGMVFPPMIHMGLPTMGRAWFANREPAKEMLARLGLRVPLDDVSPLAPFGSMLVARPEALRPLLDADFLWEEFPDEGGYGDGGMAHVLERMFAYSAIGSGHHVRTVMTTRNAAISHTMLEYKLNAMDDGVPGEQREQIAWVQDRVAGRIGVATVKAAIVERSPAAARVLKPIYVVARGVLRKVRGR